MPVVTRVYPDLAAAERAHAKLTALRGGHIDVSLVGGSSLQDSYEPAAAPNDEASGTATGAGIGSVAGAGAGLLAGLGAISIPGIGPLVAAGWLATAAAGAVGGAVAGSAIGALTDMGVSDSDAPVFDEAMRRGNVALTVRFPEERRAEVIAALDQVPAVGFGDLRTRFEAEGWNYDTAETTRRERLRGRSPLPPL
ncbi:hypothetical protein V6L76_07820 [Pannonibacter sp. Pt2]|uniref:DUF1269 domain-containing protein n=1 Tax=Pannonibacter anstelovis TaxID=3121537 RepID=A0ABU7ZLV6_9HYPH